MIYTRKFEFELAGHPIAWKRARTNAGRYYDPQADEKLNVQSSVIAQIDKLRHHPFPNKHVVHVLFQFYFPFPKSLPKSQRVLSPYVGKKDLSNLIKFYEDALNGILWEDDRYIVSYMPPEGYNVPLFPQKMMSEKAATFITVWLP